MSSRILVDRNKPEAAELLRFVNAVQLLLSQGRRIKRRLDSMASGADWHQVAIELGLPDPAIISSTAAMDLWNIVSTAMASIDSAAVAELNRLDQA